MDDLIWYEYRRGGCSWVLTDRVGSCFWCGGPTNSLDVNFETYLHQGVCTMLTDNDYWYHVGMAEMADLYEKYMA